MSFQFLEEVQFLINFDLDENYNWKDSFYELYTGW